LNVYVESNFVLELSLRQEDHAACQEILSLCESGGARLVIPAYCLMEPYETLGRRQAHRRDLKSTLDQQFRQIARTDLYRNQLGELERATTLLVKSANEDLSRLESVKSRLLGCAELAPLDSEVLGRAAVEQVARPLSAQDAVVYASILVHLERSAEAGCFVTRDADFADREVKRELEERSCRVLIGFQAGLEFLRRPMQNERSESDPE
jgi:predicted nucleic acid-binding protein